jgi:L-ribulose-5-phosphate 3-epimerase
MLAIETMETDFMNTTGKAMSAVKYVNSPYLQIYPDIGNIYNATPDPPADFKTGEGHIVAAHLKETIAGRFREIPYGEGQVDFPASIAQLYDQGVRRYVAEYWSLGEENWKEIARGNRAFIDKQFEKAAIRGSGIS